jgi:hypothetical protein
LFLAARSAVRLVRARDFLAEDSWSGSGCREEGGRGEGESTSTSAIAGATVEHDVRGKGGNGAEKAGAGCRGRIFLWIMMGKDGRQGSRRRWGWLRTRASSVRARHVTSD